MCIHTDTVRECIQWIPGSTVLTAESACEESTHNRAVIPGLTQHNMQWPGIHAVIGHSAVGWWI
ncbi:hypothetical protein DPMN_149662 [Dreissena polymorpha]|uniref:Uncharacterized protein n=1 Tax=Dreissena polymorpha TaxID=45954 RepID=A0A9D4FGE0_DREPO|nr:hypothetical protein DPMN_149662 [Dreissena polymorpha]